MGLFGGTQIETNKRNLVRNVIAWIGFNRTTDSNKIEVIVLDDQKSRELRRIRTTGVAVYLDDCTIYHFAEYGKCMCEIYQEN